MSEQPNISQILAALSQRPSATPPQSQHPQHQLPPQQHAPPHGHPPSGYPLSSYPPSYPPAGPPVAAVPYSLPQPSSSGSIDLSNIKPVNSGSVAVQDAVARARGIAAEKGNGYGGMRAGNTPTRDTDARLAGSMYQRSRTRSRSPVRVMQGFPDSYNPYRDERRDDARRPMVMPYGRQRTFSPESRGPPLGARFTPPPGQGYGGPYDRPPMSRGGGETNTETIPIESGVVGLIIGRQGENLRRVEAETGTRVQFITGPDSVGPMRECKITGPKAAREAAKEEIFRVIEENGNSPSVTGRAPPPPGRDMGIGAKAVGQHQPALRAGEESTQIMVPNRTVGLIIGRGGETIRDLQERSGCHVNIVGEEKSVNGLRPVNLIGTPYTSGMAKNLIMEIVESDTKSLANQGGGAAPRAQPGLPAFGVGDGEKINDRIMVPSEAVGMIIGKGGETIKNMQAETGCKINVSPASGQDFEREIGLVGSRDAIEQAKGAIMEKVHAVQEKNSRPGGGRPRDDNQYNQQPTFSQSNQQPLGQRNTQTQPPPAASADPYAAYGGYENYVALWYSSQMQQQQQAQQNPQGPPPP